MSDSATSRGGAHHPLIAERHGEPPVVGVHTEPKVEDLELQLDV